MDDTSMADTSLFLRTWMKNPLRTAAVAPSSEKLGKIITSEIGPDTGPVLELGPGTGVFTRALLDRGVAESDLTLIEASEKFAKLMNERFPKAEVKHMDAGRLSEMAQDGFRKHGAAVSGLGLLAMPEDLVQRIMAGAFDLLEPGAAFYQFTYGWKCPVPQAVMHEQGLRASKMGHALWNLPPARVWKVVKGASAS